MIQLGTVVIALILTLLLSYNMFSYGESIFHPKKVEISISNSVDILINENKYHEMNFTKDEKEYVIRVPEELNAMINGNLKMDYNWDRGYITSIENIYSNDLLVADNDYINNNVVFYRK